MDDNPVTPMRNPDFPAFLYVLEDPREPGDIRYIGATSSLSGRLTGHRAKSRTDLVSELYQWWRQLLSEGVEPVMRLLWQGTSEQRDAAEIKAIKGYRKLGFSLLNITDGGNSPHRCSEETREKLRAKSTGRHHSPDAKKKMSRWHTGKKLSMETRRRMAQVVSTRQKGIYPESLRKSNDSLKGIPRSDEVKRKISEAHLGKKLSPEHREKVIKTLRPAIAGVYPEGFKRANEARKEAANVPTN